MSRGKALVLVAVVLLAAGTATFVPPLSRGVRSVRRLFESPGSASTRFDPAQSAALFIGVRDFETLSRVPFAVDDAVDLAYLFAHDRRVGLVPAARMVLLLTGEPVKQISKDHLEALRKAGADVRRATVPEIERALREQAARAGRDGMLIVFAATHGIQRGDTSYLLGVSSTDHDPASMLSSSDLFDVIASSKAQRSLVFIDACRQRTALGVRAVLASAAAAPLFGGIGHRRGQAVFYAAAAGQWAYDDFVARNGVFTKAVIDGMQCRAAKEQGMVTAQTLASYVEKKVHQWIRANKDPSIGSATQSSIDGGVLGMPLTKCWGPATSGPERVIRHGNIIHAFSGKDALLWQWNAGATVIDAQPLDLDADGTREVAFGTRDRLGALDAAGNLLWSASEPMPLKRFVPADLSRQHRNDLVALWSDGAASCLAAYGADGTRLGEFESDRPIDRMIVDRPTPHYAPRIFAMSGDTLLVFDRKNLAAGRPRWSGRASATIQSVNLTDDDGDGTLDINLTTASGGRVIVDINGRTIRENGAHFERLSARSRTHSPSPHRRGRMPPPAAPAE